MVQGRIPPKAAFFPGEVPPPQRSTTRRIVGNRFRLGAMRWLMIALLGSLAALLLAAAGVARHIWLQRSRLSSNPAAGPPASKPGNGSAGTLGGAAADPGDESERDFEI
jgi:hypothetical protein